MTPSPSPSPLPDRASILAWTRVSLPIGITFLPLGFTTGMAAKVHGFTGLELGVMAALIYAAPVQLAVIELWTAGAPLAQMILTAWFINLRFIVISLTLVPYFLHLRRAQRAVAAQAVAMSSFAGTFAPMQQAGGAEAARIYLSVAVVVYPIWIAGCLAGFALGTRIPARYDEALRFVFPLFVTALVAADVRGARPLAAAAAGFLLAPWAVASSPRWGLILTAVGCATLASLVEEPARRRARTISP